MPLFEDRIEAERDQGFRRDDCNRHPHLQELRHQDDGQAHVQDARQKDDGVDEMVEAQREHPLDAEHVAQRHQRREKRQDAEDRHRLLESRSEGDADQARRGDENGHAHQASGHAHYEKARSRQPRRITARSGREVAGARKQRLSDRIEQRRQGLADALRADVITHHERRCQKTDDEAIADRVEAQRCLEQEHGPSQAQRAPDKSRCRQAELDAAVGEDHLHDDRAGKKHALDDEHLPGVAGGAHQEKDPGQRQRSRQCFPTGDERHPLETLVVPAHRERHGKAPQHRRPQQLFLLANLGHH